MSRELLDIDEKRVAELALEGCSNRDIAALLGCDDTTIGSRFPALLKKKRAERRLALREQQNKEAKAGNVGMLIWLGKNVLGQTDKKIITKKTDSADQKPQIVIPNADPRPRKI